MQNFGCFLPFSGKKPPQFIILNSSFCIFVGKCKGNVTLSGGGSELFVFPRKNQTNTWGNGNVQSLRHFLAKMTPPFAQGRLYYRFTHKKTQRKSKTAYTN